MSGDFAFDMALCLLIVMVAGCAVAAPGMFVGVVFFIIYGLFIAVAWVRLGAYDVALAEAAIGAGLTGVLLIGAVARLGMGTRSEPPAALLMVLRNGAGPLLAALALMFLVAFFPSVAPGLRQQIGANIDATGVTNPVTAVLLNFRGYDTLLETFVLLAALVAVWALTPEEYWGERAGLREHARPDGVLASFGRVLIPLIMLVGVYIFWAGADKPGGAFQGGAVLAAGWILVIKAELARAPIIASMPSRLITVAGPALFVLFGLTGLWAGNFLIYPPDMAKAVLLGLETVLTLSIAAMLALLVLGLPRQAK